MFKFYKVALIRLVIQSSVEHHIRAVHALCLTLMFSSIEETEKRQPVLDMRNRARFTICVLILYDHLQILVLHCEKGCKVKL